MTIASAALRRPHASFQRTARWAGFLLGFAMGGFFDGILFHQVLQWHHLLSNVGGSWTADIRVQILADGLFHVAMYIVAAVGLWMLWRGRHAFASPDDAGQRRLLADFLLGFGVWHIVDAVLFHWILRIHHVRMDSDSYLLWDVLLFAFGMAFMIAGWRAGRGKGDGPTEGGTADMRAATGERARRYVIPLLLAGAVSTAGPVAALPPANASAVTVLFRQGTPTPAVFAAVESAKGRIVWSNDAGDVWLVDVSAGGDARRQLYAHGALYVSGSLLPIGCVASRGT
jgi:uncharacterized membrane protein